MTHEIGARVHAAPIAQQVDSCAGKSCWFRINAIWGADVGCSVVLALLEPGTPAPGEEAADEGALVVQLPPWAPGEEVEGAPPLGPEPSALCF